MGAAGLQHEQGVIGVHRQQEEARQKQLLTGAATSNLLSVTTSVYTLWYFVDGKEKEEEEKVFREMCVLALAFEVIGRKK